MNMKKNTAYAVLICLLILVTLCAGCGGVEIIHYNGLTISGEDGIQNIEGSYTKDMGMVEFEKLTNLQVPQSLPESYQNKAVSANALYDKDGNIINITVGIGKEDNGYPVTISVYATDLWSKLGYSPIDAMYDSTTSDLEITTLDQTSALFYRYDDSKQENKLGHDIYLAQFKNNAISVYVESSTMNEEEFGQFVTTLNAKAHNLG